MAEPKESEVEQFLRQLMEIERQYANELKNAKTKRQEDIRDLLNKCTARESTDAD